MSKPWVKYSNASINQKRGDEKLEYFSKNNIYVCSVDNVYLTLEYTLRYLHKYKTDYSQMLWT